MTNDEPAASEALPPLQPDEDPRRAGIDEWEARALAGMKRMNEDEEYRLSLNARLS